MEVKPNWRAYLTPKEREAHEKLDGSIHHFRLAIATLQYRKSVYYERAKKRRKRA